MEYSIRLLDIHLFLHSNNQLENKVHLPFINIKKSRIERLKFVDHQFKKIFLRRTVLRVIFSLFVSAF